MFSSIPSVYSSIQLTVTSDQDLILNLTLERSSVVDIPIPEIWVCFASWSNHGKPHIAWVNIHIFQDVLKFSGLRSSSSSSPDDKNHHLSSSTRRTSWVFHIYHPIYHRLSPFIIIYHHKSTINHPQLSTINHLPRKDILGFLALGRPVFAAWGRSGNSSEWRRDSAEWRVRSCTDH